MPPRLTVDAAERFARIALGHVTREYPHKLDHVLAGPADARTPSALHPIFHGSFDWHSCVHAYWLLARLLRLMPDLPVSMPIRALFDRRLTSANVAGECAYLARPGARGFERPYGWAWLLKLAAELADHADRRWSDALAPLAAAIAARLGAFLPAATCPVRVGTHFNTAFALRMAADAADARQDAGLTALLRETALRWYGADVDCPAWGEPGGDDFLPSTLIEAECMRRLLPPADFMPWFDRFLPHLSLGKPVALFTPVLVGDRCDGKTAHLDGLNLSRAWCWRSLAGGLPTGDPRVPMMQAAADDHLAAGLPHVSGDYMGEHWLASFALLAVEA